MALRLRKKTLVRTLLTTALLLFAAADSTVSAQAPEIYSMVSEMRRDSREDALTIKEEYAPLVATAVFADLDHLRRAIDTGELVALSSVELPHVQPRLYGESPIAQKDLENQQMYVALRPATMGLLIDIARRVQRGPLDVTSLVRTAEYQRALMRGNGNANTDVPTHTMGYALDIGLKFMAPDTAIELRRVLEEMRAAGDIYFIAEANQLTFHIVPVLSRLEHFEAIYQEAATPPAPAAPVPVPPPAPSQSRLANVWSWITSLFE